MAMKSTRSLGVVVVGSLILISPILAESPATANCGTGSIRTTTSQDYACGTNPDGSTIWGTRTNCYIQFCDEDAVPAYRNPCYWTISCPGAPPSGDACPDAYCPVSTAQCRQVCDEICGNGIDDNGDGRVDEGCGCSGSEAGCCEGSVGHPVALQSGGVSTDVMEDFSLPTPGMPVSLERTWISSSPDQVSSVAAFGKRWHSNLEERLTIAGSTVTWYRADGHAVTMPVQSGTSPEGFSTRLIADPTGYRLIETSGVTTYFDLNGRLRKRLQNGHGLADVVYNDEAARSDCPADGTVRICTLHDSRGTEVRLSWTGGLVTSAVVAPGTVDAWTVQYQYDGAGDQTLAAVASPLRTVAYTYSADTALKGNLLSVALIPATGQPPILLEQHDWYDSRFPPSVRGRARVSIGRNSEIAFRWGDCELSGTSPYCQIGDRAALSGGTLPAGQTQTAVFDLRSTDRDAGTACSGDGDCSQGFACIYTGTTSPGGHCRATTDGDVVTMQNGRVVSRTVGCSTCNGEPSITWDAATGVKKTTLSETNRRTTYQYDSSGRVTRMIENDTDSDPTTVPNTNTYRLTTTTYDSATGRPATVTETSNVIASGVRSQSVTYNADGLVASIALSGYTRQEGSIWSKTVSTRTTTFSYQNGLLSQVDGPRSDVSDVLTIEYYPATAPAVNDRLRLYRLCRSTGNTARPTLCTVFSNYDVWGNAGQVADPDGVTSALTYDSSGRLVTLVRDTTAPTVSVAISYDGAGQVSTYKEESGRCRLYQFGNFGSLQKVSWRASCDPSSELLREGDFTLDGVGRTTRDQTLVAGNVVSDVQFTYDGRGRFQKAIKPSLSGSPYQLLTRTAVGFVSKSEDEDCWPVRLPTCFSETYDWSGQDDNLSTITDAVTNAVTSFVYDRDGHPKQISTPGGVSATYEYDDFGALTATTSSESSQGLLQTYNAAGQLVGQYDDYWGNPLQRITRDPLGRPKQIVFGPTVTCTTANNGTLLSEKRYSYDVAPGTSKLPAGTFLAGRPAHVEVDQQCDSSSSTGRMTLVTDYGYNSAGQTTDVLEYATSGLPTEFGSPGAPLATQYHYRPDGQVDRITYPDGDAFTYDFDAQGRATGITGTDDGVQTPLISGAQYRDPVTGVLASWTNHITLGGQP